MKIDLDIAHSAKMHHILKIAENVRINEKLALSMCMLLIFFSIFPVKVCCAWEFIDTEQQLGMSADAFSIALGDLNIDGYLDLVIVSNESNTIIQAYLNNGEGYFEKLNYSFPISSDSNPLWNFGIVLKDFNSDGFLDIATADAWRGVNVYLNLKDSFNWNQAILVPEVNEVKGVDSADVDNDGDVDLVFGGHNGIPDRGDRIYFNDGAGNFIDSGQRIGNDVTWDTIFGDIDNDGDFDYISINRYREHPSKVHINDGTGNFEASVDIITTQTDDSYDVKLADLNMDGLLDLVIANSIDVQQDTTSKIFINQGNGSFLVSSDKLGPPDCETKGLELIDINNDGYYDIVLGNYNQANMIYTNNGFGVFIQETVSVPTNGGSAIAAGDLNNDGYVDLVTGSKYDGFYRVYLNSGHGLLQNISPVPPLNQNAKSIGQDALFQWDHGFDPSGMTLEFPDSLELADPLNTCRLALTDINGDGALDILEGNGEELRQRSQVYLNDGFGHFTNTGQILPEYFLRDMTVGDIDDDGDVDWIMATQGDGVKIWKNDGSGLFQLSQSLGSSNIYVRAVDLGDVDGDGDLDLLYGSVGNRIFLNDGNGNFSDSDQGMGDQYLTQVVRFADLDQDGDLDFIQGNRVFEAYDMSNRIYFNNGNGLFVDSLQNLGQGHTMGLDVGDVDGDGDLDLVAVNSPGLNKVYLNNGNGFFVETSQTLDTKPEGNESKAVHFGDMDKDGDLDIIFGNYNIGITVYLNDGSGLFSEYMSINPHQQTAAVAIGDVDMDGDLDVIQGIKSNNPNKIYINNQAGTALINLTYNLRVGTQPGQNDIISGASGNGPGNLGHRLSHVIKGLQEGTYYWSVQTVDSGFRKSAWSKESTY